VVNPLDLVVPLESFAFDGQLKADGDDGLHNIWLVAFECVLLVSPDFGYSFPDTDFSGFLSTLKTKSVFQ